MEMIRISQGAVYRYCGGDAWVVGVQIQGTDKYGIAMTDKESYWDFEECDEETAREVGQ